MKKFCLICLLCLLFPCYGFAQTPESAFSVDGTVWHGRLFVLTAVFSIPPFYLKYLLHVESIRYGIYEGEIYWCGNEGLEIDCTPRPVTNYYPQIVIDSPVVSLGYVRFGRLGGPYQLAFMQPTSGLGYFTSYNFGTFGGAFFKLYRFGIMVKVDDNWTPSEEE